MATDTTLNGAILFLPMIHDYLTQYMDMLTSNLDARTCSSPQNSLTSSGLSKSSFDSSVESLTSSLDMLLKDSADYANNLENMTLVTLQIVHKLVSFSSVIRNILLNVDSDTKLVEESTEEVNLCRKNQSINTCVYCNPFVFWEWVSHSTEYRTECEAWDSIISKIL